MSKEREHSSKEQSIQNYIEIKKKLQELILIEKKLSEEFKENQLIGKCNKELEIKLQKLSEHIEEGFAIAFKIRDSLMKSEEVDEVKKRALQRLAQLN
ncbi:MAG: hypothetical protein OXC92_04505 [Flavobacteriaceae bacterium]|nr:hypothetical protein [Flavobacteriaceae bacterium]MCY4216229.1 hypothetical protein [Flavobacteriaceae bacterium]MCY4267091.1 hypothetical protein [Flavobacteriaceae bacterium]MCY4298339.1 hypothetical protein [Flavobacteriaceae bacterium]